MASTFASMVGVGVTTWNARASIVADPISLNIAYGGNSIGVSDSSLALSVELSSAGEYFTTLNDFSNSDTSLLRPLIDIPVSAEIKFDINVSNVSLIPIFIISSDDVTEDDFFSYIDFDLDLKTFIENFDLETVLTNITSLLTVIENYGPNLTVANVPSAVTALFDKLKDAKEFGAALQQFTNITSQGEVKVTF